MSRFGVLFELDKLLITAAGKLLSLTRIRKYMLLRSILNKNRALLSCKRSDLCYVIGLGPSLRQVDIEALDGDLIVVNRFNRFDVYGKCQPLYYCIIDEAFFTADAVSELEDAFEKYPNANFILNANYSHNLRISREQEKNTFYSCLWNGWLGHSRRFDFTKNLPIFPNVIGFAIALAIYVGYKEIRLIGCDYNSFASTSSVHCYKENVRSRKWSMAFELFSYAFTTDMHYQLNRISQRYGVRILNATAGSLLDAYERIDL